MPAGRTVSASSLCTLQHDVSELKPFRLTLGQCLLLICLSHLANTCLRQNPSPLLRLAPQAATFLARGCLALSGLTLTVPSPLQPPFEKNFYVEHPDVTARSEAEVAAYRARREIHVEGTGVPKPVQSFDEASFPGKLTVTWAASLRKESSCSELLAALTLWAGPPARMGWHAAADSSSRSFRSAVPWWP